MSKTKAETKSSDMPGMGVMGVVRALLGVPGRAYHMSLPLWGPNHTTVKDSQLGHTKAPTMALSNYTHDCQGPSSFPFTFVTRKMGKTTCRNRSCDFGSQPVEKGLFYTHEATRRYKKTGEMIIDNKHSAH